MSLWPKPLLNRVVDQRIMISLVYKILFHAIATRTKWLVARGTILYSTVVQHQSIVRLSVRLHVSDKDLGRLMDSLEVDFTSRYYGINTPSCRLHWRRELLTDALKMTPKKNIKTWLDWWNRKSALNNYQSWDTVPIIMKEWMRNKRHIGSGERRARHKEPLQQTVAG